jgi:hypothetical protein
MRDVGAEKNAPKYEDKYVDAILDATSSSAAHPIRRLY